MKEFLGTTLGKVIAVLAALVVFGGRILTKEHKATKAKD